MGMWLFSEVKIQDLTLLNDEVGAATNICMDPGKSIDIITKLY